MKDLDSLLEQGEPEERKKAVNNGLDSLHITNYAFEKAYAYAKLACERARRTIECGGYLIAPKRARGRIATDSFLARNQDVSDGLFTIEAEDVIKAGREINEMGYRVLGWWHSHGNLRTFFSPTDDNGQRTVLNEIAAINYITQRDDKEVGNLEVRTEDGKIVMFDRRSPERKYEIEVERDPSKISIAKLRLQQEKKIGFAYGLVVNVPGNWGFYNLTHPYLLNLSKSLVQGKKEDDTREPYAEIATRELCGFCRNSKDESAQVDVTIFDTGKVEIDESALMTEIDERVNIRPRFFGFRRRGKGSGRSHLPAQEVTFWEGYGHGYPRRDYDFRQIEFGAPAQDNPQLDLEKQSDSTQKRIGNLLDEERKEDADKRKQKFRRKK